MASTLPAFHENPYLESLDSRINRVCGHQIVLQNTVFYPNGGGQPGDTGIIKCNDRELRIINTRRCRETGDILHELDDSTPEFHESDSVWVSLDWARRYAHMRMHSCLHLLCSMIPFAVTGCSITDTKGRLDFNVTDSLPSKDELTSQLNRLIQQGIPVLVESLDEAIIDEQPELVKTLSVQPPRGAGRLRMIRIENTDFQPCGGTHVANTREIGSIKVAKIESKGKNNKRIQIVFAD